MDAPQQVGTGGRRSGRRGDRRRPDRSPPGRLRRAGRRQGRRRGLDVVIQERHELRPRCSPQRDDPGLGLPTEAHRVQWRL